ncbi:MAG: peptidylprolyl isomerase [Cyclobacteriaceae bacterium]|nr:peptidylprolyl isomerase [Cyclobacteriaceae bacterium]
MRKALFILIVLVVAGQVAAQSSEKKSKPLVLFTVKNTPVYTDEFIYLYKKNHLNKEDFTDKKVNEYIDLFVNFKLKVMEAKSRGLDTTVAFIKEFKSYKDELKKPYLAEKDELDRLTKEVYQRLLEEVKASHILVFVKPDAASADTLAALSKIQSIRTKIVAGGKFETVAKELSEDPSAKSNGGSLGYFTAMQMVYPFEQAAYNLKVGEVSQPVRTRFGYHLITLVDRRPARGEVEVSHIILRTGSPDDKKVKNKILEIYDQLRGGRSWDELCKEYSEDQSTKDAGGKLRPFGVGALSNIPEFESIAFSLKPGEISDPFQTAYGWHIVRSERKIPVPSYEDLKDGLQKRVARDERLQQVGKKLMEEKKKQFGYSENTSVKNDLLNSADSSLLNGRWKYKGAASLKAQTLFTLNSKNYQAGQVIAFVEKSEETSPPISPSAYMNQLYNRFVEERLSEAEDEKLMAEKPDFRNLLTEYKEGILLFTIMEKEIWTRDAGDTVALRKIYEQNKMKYTAGERVHARIFTTSDKVFLEQVKKKIANGDSLKKEDLKKFKTAQPFRNYAKGENKAVDKAGWAIGLHYTEIDGIHYMIEMTNLVPPGIKSFQEAHAQVVSDSQELLEKNWLAELKLKYPVRINNKGKKFVVLELTKK